MADRTQRVKGKANEAAGKAKANVGYTTGSRRTEAKCVGKAVKGKAHRLRGRPAAPSRRRRAEQVSSAVEEAAAQRIAGEQPLRTRAFVAAAAAAVATGTLVYRLLRS